MPHTPSASIATFTTARSISPLPSPVASEHTPLLRSDSDTSLGSTLSVSAAENGVEPRPPSRANTEPSWLGRLNLPDRITSRWVHPRINATLPQPSHWHAGHPVLTANDRLRRDIMVGSVQWAFLSLATAGVADQWAPQGPSTLNPSGQRSPTLGAIYLGAGLLGFTFGGSYVGAHLADALLTGRVALQKRFAAHRFASTALGLSVASIGAALAFLQAMQLLGDADHRARQAPADAPYGNYNDEVLAAQALLLSVPALACAGYYAGAMVGIVLGHAVHPTQTTHAEGSDADSA